MSRERAGRVVATQQLAADAGAAALLAGGSAVDAAVAAGFALCVVDAANCGVGGYGGYLMYAPPGVPPVAVEFDTWVPARFPAERLRIPGATDPHAMVDGGAAVAPPAVVPGLLVAHSRFGRRPLEELVAPAIRLARSGFPVGPGLAWALSEHWRRRQGDVGDDELRSVFYPGGRALQEGETLVQPDLAATLEAIVREREYALRAGPLAEAICGSVNADGGTLDLDDLGRDGVVVREAPEPVALGPATVYGPSRAESGTGVLFSALGEVDLGRVGSNRSRAYVDEIVRALAHAWNERLSVARSAVALPHTTTLGTASEDGGLAALTFTHGPWFGAGIMPPGTGVVLNGGANLFAATPVGGRAITNMSPLVVELADGARHVVGATGGPRIPGMLFTAVVDVVHYGRSLAEAIAAPHVSARAADGRPEVESPLDRLFGSEEATVIAPGDFGPAYGISRLADGYADAVDDRFEHGFALA
jgi:gamma-glutamyltranspeptidase/glutathione hydrolase